MSTHIDVPPGRAAQSLWCDRNWHDGTCCSEPAAFSGLDTTAAGWSWAEPHARGDHSACNRNCEHTL
jgi:hypothetical protein